MAFECIYRFTNGVQKLIPDLKSFGNCFKTVITTISIE